LRSFIGPGRVFWETQERDETFKQYFNASEDWYHVRKDIIVPPNLASMDKKFYEEEESNAQKYLWSASWGNWFGDFQHLHEFREIVQNRFGCDEAGLQSQLMNALFRPTTRTRILHSKRLERLNISSRNAVIHLRSEMMGNFSDDQYARGIRRCMNQTSFQGQWWLITDRDYFTHRLAKAMDLRFDNAAPLFWEKTHTAFLDNFNHHDTYQPSLLDWYAIWASETAMILHGAFGLSGGMGSHKVCRRACATGEEEPEKSGKHPVMTFLLCEKDVR